MGFLGGLNIVFEENACEQVLEEVSILLFDYYKKKIG